MKLFNSKTYIKKFASETKETQFPMYMDRLRKLQEYLHPQISLEYFVKQCVQARKKNQGWQSWHSSMRRQRIHAIYTVCVEWLRGYDIPVNNKFNSTQEFIENLLDIYGQAKVLKSL